MYAYADQLPTPRRHVRRPLRQVRRVRTLRMLCLALLTAVVLVFVPKVALSMGGAEAPVMRSYTVQAGDTLWEIAAKNSQGRDLRDVISRIKAINHLSSANIQPGVTLQIPADWSK